MQRFALVAGMLVLGSLAIGADARPRIETPLKTRSEAAVPNGVFRLASGWRRVVITSGNDRCRRGPPSARGKTAQFTIWVCQRSDGKLQRDYYNASGYLFSLLQV